MWVNHIKFGIAVVLVTLIALLGNLADLVIGHPRSTGVTWKFYKKSLNDTKEVIYYK